MEQTKVNKAQVQAIAIMCINANISKETKISMVLGFSGGRCESSRDLTYAEAIEMLRHLASLSDQDKRLIPMRNKIFYYAHEMKWTKTNKDGKVVADGKRVDEWMIKYSYKKKKLNHYTYAELPKLVSQFEHVYKHFLNNI